MFVVFEARVFTRASACPWTKGIDFTSAYRRPGCSEDWL